MRASAPAPLLLLLVPVLLTGCGSSGLDVPLPSSSAAPVSSAPAASATASASASAGASTDPSAAPSAVASASTGLPTTPNCGGPTLEIALYSTDAGAGNVDYTIAFTNRGTTTCHVSGAPRAVLIGADGDPIGPEAEGSGREGDFVEVRPNRSAYTTVRAVNVGTDGGPLAGRCTPQEAVAIAIDAPNYDRYEQVPVTAAGCAEGDIATLTVTVLRGAA